MCLNQIFKAFAFNMVLGLTVYSQTASISGVVSNQTTDLPIAGAQIILREGSTGSGGGGRIWTPIDTVITGANGSYSFTALSAATYQVAASADGYQSSSNQVTLTGTQVATNDISLTPALTGKLVVFTGTISDSSAIASATVSARTGGSSATPLTGVSNAGGWITFVDVSIGTYVITVSANGYAIGSAQTTVEAGQSDTVRVYLGIAVSGTKVVKGTIKTAQGASIRAIIVLTAGTGSSRITLIDSSDNAGSYLISSIPSTETTGRLSVSASGFVSSEQQTSLTSDTTTVDFVLASQTTVIKPTMSSMKPFLPIANQRITFSADGRVSGTSAATLKTSRIIFIKNYGSTKNSTKVVLER